MTRDKQTKPEAPPRVDLLYGSKAVAEFLGVKRSVAVHLIRARLIPAFELGGIACARRSSLTRHLDALERAANG